MMTGHRLSRLLATLTALVAAASLSACALPPPPSTAFMPVGSLGSNADPDVRALELAADDFDRPMVNDPAQAADAIAALDYMGGKLNSSSRWVDMPSLWALQMLQSREQLRHYVGISQAAPSQAVVNTMLALAKAYRAGNQARIQSLLSQPIFTAPPAEVQARLSNIPFMATVNAATTHAEEYAYPHDFDHG